MRSQIPLVAPLIRGRNERIFRITQRVCRAVLSLFFRMETSGAQHLPQKEAFILLPKHQRWEDIPLLSLATPRPLYYVAKSELFHNPLSKWFLTSLGGIPLNRQRPLESRRSLLALICFLKEGEGAVVFPEGTYYQNKMGPGQVGMVRLILSRLTIPFIPVGIRYARERTRIVVRVKFGKAFHADSKTPANAFVDRMMLEIAQLSGFA
jgi:1-acyl-sn-glycerol-3-phosphate acyltransferase